MKVFLILLTLISLMFLSPGLSAQTGPGAATSSAAQKAPQHLYLDMHHVGPGKVKYEDVAKAHAKDLATENKYNVHFLQYWVDEAAGNVYCLASAPDSLSIRQTHAEAHGLLPDRVFKVSEGVSSAPNKSLNYYLDVHELGAGKVKAADVAGAHEKDLVTEKKYGVNFITYWVDEKNGQVVCLSQAPDSNAIINTHREAHGLLPTYIVKVKPGK